MSLRLLITSPFEIDFTGQSGSLAQTLILSDPFCVCSILYSGFDSPICGLRRQRRHCQPLLQCWGSCQESSSGSVNYYPSCMSTSMRAQSLSPTTLIHASKIHDLKFELESLSQLLLCLQPGGIVSLLLSVEVREWTQDWNLARWLSISFSLCLFQSTSNASSLLCKIRKVD